MKAILLLSLALVLITACKEKEKKTTTLTGRLLINCNGAPMTNATVSFYEIQPMGPTGALITSATTDSSGNFTATYKTGDVKMRMYINGQKYMLDVKGYEDISFGDLYLSPVMKAVVRIKVLNPPANNTTDTLFCWPYGGGYSFRCPQPIHDTVFPVGYFTTLGPLEYKNNGKLEMEFGWQYGNLTATRVYQLLSPCTQTPDTFDITVH